MAYFDLNKYKKAQDTCYKQVLQEIKNGKKTTHWMWFVFPQIKGLGKSDISKLYEISDIEEAIYFLHDKVLADRLIELISILLNEINSRNIVEIFGYIDSKKFHSSMTLFYFAVKKDIILNNNPKFGCFESILYKYFNKALDTKTVSLLKT